MRITFRPGKPEPLKPVSAIAKLPDWYKKLGPYTNGAKREVAYSNTTKNVTIKRCNPFGDALGAGYFILLDQDIQVTIKNGSHDFVWLAGGQEVISHHKSEQISTEMIPQGYSPVAYKFKNIWGIATPPGHSVLITHPLNRLDLPFYTLAGIVDTDDFNLEVHFPFFLRSDFEGILEAGTPIAQVIPFKRQGWEKEFLEYEEGWFENALEKFHRHIIRPYKRFFWKRKDWK